MEKFEEKKSGKIKWTDKQRNMRAEKMQSKIKKN